MPSYPGQSFANTKLTVDAMLKQPALISRALVNLTSKRFVADQIFVRGTSEMVAGGAMRYQRDESIFLGTGAEELGTGEGATVPFETGPRGKWLRATWSEEVRTEAIKEFGLEVLVTNLAIRFNVKPQLVIAQRKLANNIVRFVDSLAFSKILGDPDILRGNATVDWSDPTANLLPDLTTAQTAIEEQNQGYNGFENATLVVHTSVRDYLVNNETLATRLPREARDGAVQTGAVAPMLGFGQILYASQMDPAKAIVLDTTVAGVIADSMPEPVEGFAGYDSGDGHPPIWAKVYKEEPKDTIIAGGRWPAMAIIAPKAIYEISHIIPAT